MSIHLYLAGPMKGYPQFNFPTFKKAAFTLRKAGFDVFSPAERDISVHGEDIFYDNATGNAEQSEADGFNLRDALYVDTKYICLEADAIAMLPGWEMSLGAQAEWALAKALDLDIFYLDETYLATEEEMAA